MVMNRLRTFIHLWEIKNVKMHRKFVICKSVWSSQSTYFLQQIKNIYLISIFLIIFIQNNNLHSMRSPAMNNSFNTLAIKSFNAWNIVASIKVRSWNWIYVYWTYVYIMEVKYYSPRMKFYDIHYLLSFIIDLFAEITITVGFNHQLQRYHYTRTVAIP